MRTRAGLTVGVVSVVLLALAPAAHANQRYASPAGSGTACSQASPCQLIDAVEDAGAGDEVIVGSGNYDVGVNPIVSGAAGLDLHGALDGPAPTITGSSSAFNEVLVQLYGAGSRVSYLTLVYNGPGAIAIGCFSGAVIERVHATTTGPNSRTVQLIRSCLVRDSVAVALGDNSVALSASGIDGTNEGRVRNVTALAPGKDGVAIRANLVNVDGDPGSYVLDVRNAITNGAGGDLETVGIDGPVQVKVANSNFDSAKASEAGDSITDEGGNQTAAPLFANAAGGDFRQAAGSPTIDAGKVDSALGPLALGGEARVQGPAPDIGAYEAPAPDPDGAIQSLSISAKEFKPVNAGGAIISKKAKIGAGVTYSLTAVSPVTFTVERAAPGRRSGKKCVKQTKANKSKRKCKLFKPVKGSFTVDGVGGSNRFKFSGRIANRALKPGAYRLVGKAGGAARNTAFTIVK